MTVSVALWIGSGSRSVSLDAAGSVPEDGHMGRKYKLDSDPDLNSGHEAGATVTLGQALDHGLPG